MSARRVGVVVGLVVAIGLSPTTSAATSSQPMDLGSPELNQEAALGAFEDLASARGAIGFYRDDKTNDLVVVVPTSQKASFSLPAAPAGVSARIEAKDVDISRIQDALDVLAARGPLWTDGNGASLSSCFDPKTGKVEAAGTVDATILNTALGGLSDVVDYRPGIAVIAASRNSMNAPFLGGARAKNQASGNAWDCTTGFTVKKTSNNIKYMLTAAHCGAALSSWTSPGSGAQIGIMRLRKNATTDVAAIGDKTYQPVIYTGDVTGVASTVKGASDPVINNTSYCYSGGKTFDQCDVTVLNFSANNCYYDQCYTGQMTFQQYGRCPVLGGDSGAPFYLNFGAGGFPYIRGSVVAALSDNSVCFGERWTRLAAAFGVTIVTG